MFRSAKIKISNFLNSHTILNYLQLNICSWLIESCLITVENQQKIFHSKVATWNWIGCNYQNYLQSISADWWLKQQFWGKELIFYIPQSLFRVVINTFFVAEIFLSQIFVLKYFCLNVFTGGRKLWIEHNVELWISAVWTNDAPATGSQQNISSKNIFNLSNLKYDDNHIIIWKWPGKIFWTKMTDHNLD